MSGSTEPSSSMKKNKERVHIEGIFPSPVYFAHRGSKLGKEEMKDVDDIIGEGLLSNSGNSFSSNTYIFDTRLHKLRKFCERHIAIYVKEIINPKNELDFYITQSWLNVNKPGESHHKHCHPNSLISGVFYVSSGRDDKIDFYDPNSSTSVISVEVAEFNLWNSEGWFFNVASNDLILFPSWLQHSVKKNEKASTDRISISFNVFPKGILGGKEKLTELIIP